TDKFIEHDVGLRDPYGIGGRPPGRAGIPEGMEGRERERGSLGGHVPQIEAGQEWLARHQSEDGSWKCAGFQEECDGNKCSGTGFAGYDVGVTALAVLAFTGVGNTPWHGKHRKVVRKAVRWLISQQEKDGAIGRSEAEGWMYNHAIATMALCEVRAMAGAHRHTLIRPTQAAVNFCLRAQNPGLAWRYESRSGDNDTSVTGWMLLALKAARMADIEVPDETFRSARAFLDRVTHSTGIAGYRGMDGESSYLAMQEGMYEAIPTMTAVSVLCRRLTGQSKKDPRIREGVSVLLESLPDPAERLVNHYYWYYGTYALFQASRGAQDPRWKKWHRAVIKALIPAQNTNSSAGEAGSWAPTGEWGIAGGRVYSTAINLLTLEATFRYERMD
ncbi:MAG: terpene cyclase/mutase family protein, partial [Planctomycetota bacterium]|nr:terpene cyclase/mutase family protein [Planctomycetota bacterium]